MLHNIAFIGGIHGVGKSTVCNKICKELDLHYLAASDLINWKKISENINNKKVENISTTQDLLIIGLSNTIKKNKSYLLDGHYCLLNGKNEIINVPLNTFEKIKAVSLNLIIGNIEEIKDRLEDRDNRVYDLDLLNRMQESELYYAKKLSKTLGITLNTGTVNDYSEIIISLSKIFH
ncbi:MAG: ATP-binding protein [Bacteroidota bacterium]